ncbi:hypothetical protein LAV83_30725 [Rhizobium sp. VS19-DRK62.2]|nr:hypothetical protein [Rhizobium sp. VS19-DRK62.2]
MLDQVPAPRVSERLLKFKKGKYMKAVKFNEYGGTEVLRVVEVEAPHAGRGQVRIAVRAAGVNPIDWKLRAGYVRDFMPLTFPAGVGSEAAASSMRSGLASRASPLVMPFSVTGRKRWPNRRC